MSEDLRGIWAENGAGYLTDLRHPVMIREWTQRQLRLGRRPDSPTTLRDRRQFDREMVAKYAEACPPPTRTPWQLMTYDFMDKQEEIAARQPVRVRYEEVYVDEDI